MTIDTRIPSLNGLEWGVLVKEVPQDSELRGAPLQLSLTEAREAAAAAGWRLPSLREVSVAFDGADGAYQFSGAQYDLRVQRCWLRHDYIGSTAKPTGYQLNLMVGAVWPHPADEKLSVVVVREAP